MSKKIQKKHPTHGMLLSIARGNRMKIAGTNYAGRPGKGGLPFVNLDKLILPEAAPVPLPGLSSQTGPAELMQ
jgi:hypothetical protein